MVKLVVPELLVCGVALADLTLVPFTAAGIRRYLYGEVAVPHPSAHDVGAKSATRLAWALTLHSSVGNAACAWACVQVI